MIHALTVGGGILAICPLPGSDGDYYGDLEHIRGWAPAMVLSLTTEIEMFMSKSQGLGNDLQDRGTRWLHLPVEDMGIPDAAFMARWPEVSATARRALTGRGRVLIHCKGGCGRSGMVALRLMIEAGEAPDEALARLRSVRPCAVETDAQMRWAMSAERGAATFVRHSD
ncbi:MAG: dual specificity protein phosphatase family protein [Roseivivax sp.]|nr:dual specificity protein phosphatase family protein [Roseivivax sp.]